MKLKKRRVGSVIILVDEGLGRIFISDQTSGKEWELTDEYDNRVIDERLMAELERRVRSGDIANATPNGELLTFLKS